MAARSVEDALAATSAATAGVPVTYKTDDLDYDLGLMAAFDRQPVDPKVMSLPPADREAALMKAATANVQLLVKHIFELPIEKSPEVGPVALLPERTTKLPRTKPVPTKRPETRWERFAREKGIVKHKRGRMVWDEASKEWRPRYGYKSVKKGDGTAPEDWAVEVKPGQDPMQDPWTAKDLARKDRVLKNQIGHVKNLERNSRATDAASGAATATRFLMEPPPSTLAGKKTKRSDSADGDEDGGGALVAPRVKAVAVPVAPGATGPLKKGTNKRSRLAYDSAGTSDDLTVVNPHAAASAAAAPPQKPIGIPKMSMAEGVVDGITGNNKRKRAPPGGEKLHEKAARLQMAQVSTASLGRFDRKLAGEPRKPRDPRHWTRAPNELPAADEAKRQSDILRRVLGGSGEGEGAAAGGVMTKRAEDRMPLQDGTYDDGKHGYKKPKAGRHGPTGKGHGKPDPAANRKQGHMGIPKPKLYQTESRKGAASAPGGGKYTGGKGHSGGGRRGGKRR